MEIILLLAEDPVPNIRFNVSKFIEQFYSKMTPGSKYKCETAVKKMVKDTDFDSSWFAKKALETIEKL